VSPLTPSVGPTALVTINLTVAVAVEGASYVLLDEAYEIVEVSPAAEAGYGSLRGRNVFDGSTGCSRRSTRCWRR
jgi:hypothetical protein